ncbi:MAG: hypothetical protein GY711_22380 [bacterium]|nr:hypothetical protein [bacterium]
MIERGLARLELRRTAGGALVLLALAVVIVASRVDWTPSASRLDDDVAPAVLRGLARETAWTAALALLLPAIVLHAGGIIERWRKGEADWLGAAPRSRATVLVSTWIGCSVGAFLLMTAAAVAVEVSRPDADVTPRAYASHSIAAFHRLEPGAGTVTEIASPPRTETGGWRVRVQIIPSLGANPTSRAKVVVHCGGEVRRKNDRVVRRTWIEVDLPAGDDPIVCEVRNMGGGVLALPAERTFELSAPGGSERLGSIDVLTRAACALAAIGGLALGFGAWVSGATAAILAGLVWLVPAIWLAGPSWWPGGDLGRTLGMVGEGRLAEPLDPLSFATTAIVAGAGLSIGVLGLRSWRFPR